MNTMVGHSMEQEPISVTFEKLDEKADYVRSLMEKVTPDHLSWLWNQIDISAVYHDCALEGQVISLEELKAAFDPRSVTDATSLPLYALLRTHRLAYDMIRTFATVDEFALTLDHFWKFNEIFTSNPEKNKPGEFRQDIPLHRSYFHEICHASKIEENLNRVISWINEDPETKKMHPIVLASSFHSRFMHVFPFTQTSGKVGRAIMNLILVHHGYFPAIVHATERQRYYDVLRQNQDSLTDLVVESEFASLDAATRYLRRYIAI